MTHPPASNRANRRSASIRRHPRRAAHSQAQPNRAGWGTTSRDAPAELGRDAPPPARHLIDTGAIVSRFATGVLVPVDVMEVHMKNEPIPVFATPTGRKSKGGLAVAGAITAGVLALGGAAGVLAAGHPTDSEGHAGTAASAEAEKSLPASDLFGVTTPAPEATETPDATAAAGTAIAPTSAPRPAVSASHETEHESSQETSDHASSGGDD